MSSRRLPLPTWPAFGWAISLTGDNMKRTLAIDMTDVNEATVESALDYLLESVWEMLEEDVSATEALLALGQAAVIVADKMGDGGRVH